MLTNTTNVNRYQIVGTPLSTYSISFPYWDKTEIVVYLTLSDGSLTTLTEGTNYTLSTPNGNNGTLTRVGDWTAGATNLTIVREMSFTQEVDLRNGDKIDAETLETALDDLTAQVQQLAESQSRAVISSIDEAGSSLTIPNKASRIGTGSGTMMGFGSDGESIALRDLAQFDADVASAASDASSASTSAGTATTQALKSEGYAVGEQNGSPVGNTSPYYHNNSKYYSQIAKAGADVITNNLSAINNLDTNMSDINDVADDITNVVAVAGDLTNIDSVAGDLTNIDAVNSNKTNIDTVAGISSDVTTVAGISADVTTVAGATTDIATILPDIADVTAVAGDLAKVTAVADDLTNIDTVEADLTNVDTVAGDISNVNAVGVNITNVNAVAGNATNINAVNANKTNIDTVAGKASDITTVAGKANDVSTVAGIAANVTTVAGKATEITTVAGIASDVSAVAAVDDDIAAVADELSDIGTVVTNLSDITAVGTDIAKVTAVADDLTNIDAVADDLTNIDNAEANALKAEGWAIGEQNGVPVSSGSPYYENNAKYWADAVPDLKNAINQHEARIENLEQVAGDYTVTQYRGTNSVPTGKAKNALIEALVGKTRGNNQLVKDYNGTVSNVVVDIDSCDISITGTANANATITKNLVDSIVVGHVYLVYGYLSHGADETLYTAPYLNINGTAYSGNVSMIVTATNATLFQLYFFGVSGEVANTTGKLLIRDLTLIFPEGVPADVAGCVAKYPDILKWDAVGYSLIDTEVEGVGSVFVNLWDEEWEANGLSYSTGLPDNTRTDRIRSKNYMPVNDYEALYFLMGNGSSNVSWMYFYDSSYNFISTRISISGSGSFTPVTGASYMKFETYSGYGTTYNHNIQVASDNSATKTTHHAYVAPSALSLSSPVKLRSAGSVSEVLTLETGKKTRPIGVVADMATLNWTQYSATCCYARVYGAKEGAKCLCSGLVAINDGSASSSISLGFIGFYQTQDYIYAGISSPSDVSGMTLYYELATPLSDEQVCDPVINNTIATEGGGTINTIQTQTPVIDNGLDVGYLAL